VNSALQSERTTAYGYLRPGGPNVLEAFSVPTPVPLPTEVLVRVRATGLNPVDWKTRAGAPTPAAASEGLAPHILGWDVSGVVEAVGPGTYLFAPGDEVFGMPWFPRPARANAQYVTAPSRQFARKPAGLSHVEAAGLPLAGLTAWQALTDAATVSAGDRVLVHAAGGGVGHLAVQIAKSRGAHVIGTAGAEKHPWLRSLGVDHLIDHRAERFDEVLKDVDLVVDLVGGLGSDVPERSLTVLRDGGTLVRVAPGSPAGLVEAAAVRDIRVTPELLVEPDGAGLAQLARLVEAGELRVTVEKTYAPEELAAAHRRGEEGRTAGKLVIDWTKQPAVSSSPAIA
jgi:NADPH:quinone reductase-like Zn-dependent oxidoreductase